MRNLEFNEQMREYSQWRSKLMQAIEMYQQWRHRYGMQDTRSDNTILNLLSGLKSDQITLAFVAEFSRGKTELINSLFFSETGVRLLPSSPGRTTMSPTELFWDEKGGSYIRLLNIESRLEDISLVELKQQTNRWRHVPLNNSSPSQMQEAFEELRATKPVDRDLAEKLGLWNKREAAEQGNANPETVEIPCWRHALISFPHPLLKEGLCILDTPGLNALGTEPELTLNMLPSAQTIVFLLAADTGVTKSDLEMWRNHVYKPNAVGRQSLAVVMNKIDAMWDDLAGEKGYENAIQSQVKNSAEILKIEEQAIFPVSAKQALLAKVKGDTDLFERSRLGALENFLANGILKERRKILMNSINHDIGFMVNESVTLAEGSYHNALTQLEEFRRIDFENKDMTGKLMAEMRDKQNQYMITVENFQTSRQVFLTQSRILVDSFSRERVDDIVRKARDEMAKSLTTFSMKRSMRTLFDDLRNMLQESVELSNETRRLVKAIHKKFKDEYGFVEIEPQLFSIATYQFELEQVFAEGEAFSASAKTTMTEQSVVINRLYGTLIAKARNILQQAHDDASTWSSNVMTPLMRQIRDYKKQIETRLAMLRKINEAKGNVAESIANLDDQLKQLRKQREELAMMIKLMRMEGLQFDQ